MKISIITLFPEVIELYLNTSILGRAQKKGLAIFEVINLRNYGEGKHKIVDDRPYGGGAGMVLKPDVLAKAVKKVTDHRPQETGKLLPSTHRLKPKIILTSASGKPYKQKKARELSKLDHLVIICGHYEGVDQRFIEKYVDEEISIGDYVLTGGEIPAMVIADSVVRLIQGVLEKPEATQNESFSEYLPNTTYQLLEYPQYTRPEVFEGLKTPEILLSGDHSKITDWRKKKALEKTRKIRPALLKRV